MFRHIKVGDTVTVERYKHYGDRKSEFQEFEVVKKGRLYFYVKSNNYELVFSLKDGRENANCICMNRAYISIDAYKEEKERAKKCHALYLYFICKYNLEKLSLKQLIEIEKIMEVDDGY